MLTTQVAIPKKKYVCLVNKILKRKKREIFYTNGVIQKILTGFTYVIRDNDKKKCDIIEKKTQSRKNKVN